MSEGGEDMEVRAEKKQHSRTGGECSVAGDWTGQKKPRTSFSPPSAAIVDSCEEEPAKDGDRPAAAAEDGGGGGGGGGGFTEDDDISWEEHFDTIANWSLRSPEGVATRPWMSSEESRELYQRLDIYSLRSRLIWNGEPREKLDDERLKKLLESPPDSPISYVDEYDSYYDGRFFWTFLGNEQLDLDDYQRIILGSHIECMRNYSEYHSKYKTDQTYLLYCEELSKKIKWIEKYACLDKQSPQWEAVNDKALKQSVKIAKGFPDLPSNLVLVGFEEYVYNVRWKYENSDLISLHFELWKRVIKERKSFSDALNAIYEEGLFPSQKFAMKIALEWLASANEHSCGLKYDFDTYVACIPETIPNKEVYPRIKDASGEMTAIMKSYEFYVKKKIEFARDAGVIH